MTNYTPGKWEAVTYAGDHVVTSNGELIIECSTPHVSDRDAAANARLIAAAPEMLEACKFALSVLRTNGIVEASELLAVKRLENVIEKAEEGRVVND